MYKQKKRKPGFMGKRSGVGTKKPVETYWLRTAQKGQIGLGEKKGH